MRESARKSTHTPTQPAQHSQPIVCIARWQEDREWRVKLQQLTNDFKAAASRYQANPFGKTDNRALPWKPGSTITDPRNFQAKETLLTQIDLGVGGRLVKQKDRFHFELVNVYDEKEEANDKAQGKQPGSKKVRDTKEAIRAPYKVFYNCHLCWKKQEAVAVTRGPRRSRESPVEWSPSHLQAIGKHVVSREHYACIVAYLDGAMDSYRSVVEDLPPSVPSGDGAPPKRSRLEDEWLHLKAYSKWRQALLTANTAASVDGEHMTKVQATPSTAQGLLSLERATSRAESSNYMTPGPLYPAIQRTPSVEGGAGDVQPQ